MFFSFFTAPVIFKTLHHEKAGELVGVLFPRYCLLGYVCFGLAVTVLTIHVQSVSDERLFLLAIMGFCAILAGKMIGPKAATVKKQIRESEGSKENTELKARFDKLHAWSVRLNGAILLLGLAVLWLTAGDLS